MEKNVSCMDKHAPRKLKRISKKWAPWITRGLLHKMHRRDLIEKKASSSNDHDIGEQFKCARNQANNAIKHAKRRYFSNNLEASKGIPRKTWNVINDKSKLTIEQKALLATWRKLLMNTSQILRKY